MDIQIKMKKIVVFTFLCFHCLIFAQGDYFEHIVSKGETLYQLSRKYNVRIAQIYNLNPSIEGDLIRIDQVLLIPKTGGASAAVSQQQDENFIYHIVESGETKFGLQRKYGVQISQLEADNPHIVSMLQAGHRVRVRKSLVAGVLNQNLVPTTSASNIHIVVKGETLTAISRHYNISLNDLVAVNKENLGEFLQIGQRLIIPGQQESAELSENSPVHIVQQGETKYGLSKKYNISIETIERLNPHTVPMLKAGHTLVLPASVDTTPQQIPDSRHQEDIADVDENMQDASDEGQDEEEFSEDPVVEQVSVEDDIVEDDIVEDDIVEDDIVEDVVVEDVVVEDVVVEDVISSNESSEVYIDYEVQPKETLYGLARKANLTQEELIGLNPALQDGVRIGMIIKMPAHVQQSTTAVIDSTPQYVDSSLTDLTKTLVKDSNKKLLLALPIEELDYQRYKETKQVRANRQEIEFYSGALIAIDSIQKLGVNLEMELVNSDTELLSDYILSNNPDIIVGVCSQSEDLNVSIPFVYPFTDNFDINANLFKAIPSKNLRVKVMLDYIAEKKGNVIVIGDIEKTVNRSLIAQNIPNAQFLTVNDRINPDAEHFNRVLQKTEKNFVILDTESTPLFLNATNMLLNQMADYDIQLVIVEETPVIANQEISLMRLRILKTLYTSLHKGEENKKSIFYKQYFNQNKVLPTENAIRGFNVTFDALLRLAQENSFENSVENQITQHNRQRFEYQKLEEGKYQNKAVYILYYDTDSDVKIAN